jgi:hypothetical protein
MKNSIDTVGNRTSDVPTCSAVPHPTAPPPVAQCLTELRHLTSMPSCYRNGHREDESSSTSLRNGDTH